MSPTSLPRQEGTRRLPLVIVVSPYHLTTREAPAMAALLLADRAVTLLPRPRGGADEAARVASLTPAYADLARSWQWATPLFDAGVIDAGKGQDSPLEDVRDAWRLVCEEDRFAPLRAFIREENHACEASYLAAVSRDILKGGPDPSLALVLAAALDRFGARTGRIVARSSPVSVAQRREARRSQPIFTVAAPILAQADGQRILIAREVLGDALTRFRVALSGACLQPSQVSPGDLAAAASEYAAAFDRSRPDILEDSADDDVMPVESVATISGIVLPGDATLSSSVEAMESLSPARRSHPAATSTPARLPVRSSLADRPFVSMVVKALGRKA